MLKHLQKIEGIVNFQVGQGGLFYLDRDNDIHLPNQSRVRIESKGSFYLINNKIVFQSYRGEIQLFDTISGNKIYSNDPSVEKIYIDYRATPVLENTFFATKKTDTAKYGYLDLTSANFHNIGEGISFALPQCGMGFGQKENTLIGYSLTDGEFLWRFNDFEKFEDLRQEEHDGAMRELLGCTKNSIWLSTNSGALIELDLKTGLSLTTIGFAETELPQFPFIVSEGDHIPYGELMQLDQQKEEIFGLRDHYFFHVDLTAKDLRRQYFNIGTSMNAYGINAKYRNTEYPYDESYIYFCDDRQGKIGVFDRKRKEVVWSTQLDIEQEGIAQILEMKFANNRWYVLDRHNTLHIFEKT